MNKKFLLGGMLVFCLVFVGVGCQKKTGSEETTNTQDQNINTVRGQMKNMFTEDKFNKLSLSDLVVGKTVLVSGQENPDGTIVADNIIIGEAGDDPDEFMRGAIPMGNFASNTPQMMNRGEDSSGDQNQEEIRQRFENMSDEDREQMRQEFESRGGGEIGTPPEGFGGNGSGQGRGFGSQDGSGSGSDSNASGKKNVGSAQIARVSGTILSVGDNSFTITLKDGGSKLIYFSDDTGFWGVKDEVVSDNQPIAENEPIAESETVSE